MWNLPPPPGFQGLRDDLPLHVYVRHLPHWRQVGATYFVTFRLTDSLPQARLDELAGLRREMLHLVERTPKPARNASHDGQGRPSYESPLERLARQLMAQIEHWLDEGHGRCLLRDAKLANFLIDSLHHFDGDRYELDAYVVMPNHVHAIAKPTLPDAFPLEDILGGWKQFSARRIQLQTGQRGPLWQEESYDRIIRDPEHLYRCLQYIGRNPRNAKLTSVACPRWIRPEWQQLGWQFEDP